MTWHTYQLAPIDIGWENLRTVRETAAALLERSAAVAKRNDVDDSDLRAFLRSWESAKDEATARGWEGDLRIEPAVMWIPDDTEFNYGFVFKQDNNGTTFVVSPVEMPWLKSEY